MKKKANEMISRITNKGASYADVRIHLQDMMESISTLKNDVQSCYVSEKSGFGIRVLFDGAWGFASGVRIEELDRIADKALQNAQSAARILKEKVELAPKEIYKGVYSSPCEIDPFKVPLKEKLEHLIKLDKRLQHDKFDFWGAGVQSYKRKILYVDSEGAEIEKNLVDIDGSLFILANDTEGLQQRRTYNLYQRANGTVGWENLLDEDQFSSHPERLQQELLEVLAAPVCEKEECDLIILPEMMALQTHETIGHALELDRILGYELSYAGGSHIDLQHFGSLQFGSSKLTARADGTVPNSPGSFGYDDDGVRAKNVVMIDNGVLVNAITSRQMVVEANKKAGRTIFDGSGATCRAQSFNRMPIERMNNINIDHGNDGALDDFIKGCQNGLMVESPRSWSIGSNRENFHFATEIGWKIKDGKISHVVRNATYRGDSLKFWRSLDKVGNQDTWQMQQVFNCGKGQPNQVMRLGHGIPLCLFKNVEVGY